MTILIAQNWEGATIAASTTGNQGTGTAPTSVIKSGGGAANNISTGAISGSTSFEVTGSTTDTAYDLFNLSTPTVASVLLYCNCPTALPTAVGTTLWQFYNGSSQISIQLRSNGRFYLIDAVGGGAYTTPATAGGTVTVGVPFIIDVAVTAATSTTGKAKFDLYNDATVSTPSNSMTELTANNFGTAGFASFRVGKPVNESSTFDFIFDEVRVTDQYALQGPIYVPPPPMVWSHTVAVG